MTFRPLAAVAAALVLPLSLVACGGSDDTNSGERPSAAEISAAFSEMLPSSTPDAVADCLGEKLEASELPNGVLRSLVAGDEETSVDADNEERYTEIVTSASTECAAEAMEAG